MVSTLEMSRTSTAANRNHAGYADNIMFAGVREGDNVTARHFERHSNKQTNRGRRQGHELEVVKLGIHAGGVRARRNANGVGLASLRWRHGRGAPAGNARRLLPHRRCQMFTRRAAEMPNNYVSAWLRFSAVGAPRRNAPAHRRHNRHAKCLSPPEGTPFGALERALWARMLQ